MRYLLLLCLFISGVSRAQSPEALRMALANDQMGKRKPVYIYWDAICASRINLDSGITVLYHIIEHARQTNNYEALFEGYFGLGATYSNKGKYSTAKMYYYKALPYCAWTKNPVANTCRILNNIGNSYLWQGNYQQAAYYCFRAAVLAEQQKRTNTALSDQLVRIYNNIATSLLYMNEHQKALYYLDKAEGLAYSLKHYIRLPSILNNKAMVYKKDGESRIAMKYYDSALQLARTHRHFQEEYVALYGMANCLIDDQRPEAAIPFLNAASKIKEHINPSYIARTFSSLGNIHLLRKDYKSAEYYFKQALKKGEEAGALDCILTAYKQLASLYSQVGDFSNAFSHMQVSYLLNDSLLNRESTEAVSLLEVKYRTAQKDRELAQKQLFIGEQERKIYKKNTLIGITSLSILLLTISSLFLFALYRNNRHKQSFQEEQIRRMEREQEIQQLKAIMKGAEEERKRIARELHDGIGGMLAAVKMNFSSLQNHCEPLLAHAGREHAERFTRIMDMLNETGSEIRETAHNLMPDILIRQGLNEAIRMFCDKINIGNRLYLKLHVRGDLNQLPEAFQLSVYRIIQELVQNILKHAEASNAFIHLTIAGTNEFHIMIRDNGKGFDSANAVPGIGIQNILFRVRALGGTYHADSTPETGTTIHVKINFGSFKNILYHEHSDRHSG